MTPERYDAWYETPRGRWIGEIEYRLLVELLRPGRLRASSTWAAAAAGSRAGSPATATG